MKSTKYADGTDPKEVVARSIADFSRIFQKFNEGNDIPAFERTRVMDDLDDLNSEGIDDLMEDLRLYKCELDEFLSYNDLPENMTASDIDEVKEKWGINGDVYETEYEWTASAFLDFAHHRFHGDINVIQFLTAHGGPSAGIWLLPNGSIKYWTTWWGKGAWDFFTGANEYHAREWIGRNIECKEFFYYDPISHETTSCGTGMSGAMELLRRAQEEIDSRYDEEDSE